jgi:hypothetical protein
VYPLKKTRASLLSTTKENSINNDMPSNIPKSNTFDDDTRKRLASLNTNNKSNNINNNNNVIPAFLKQITQERLLKSTFPAVEMPEWKRQLIEKKKQSQLLAAEN